MAAPVAKDEELELRVDSLAFGGNGVARLDGFVVFVRRGLPGDTVRARVTKVKRSHAEAIAVEVLEPGPSGSRRRARTSRPAAAAASRISPTRRRSRRRRRRCATRCAGSAASPSRRSSRSSRRESIFHYRNKLEYSFTQTPDGPALGFHRAGRWDEVLEIDALLAHDRARQRDPRRRPRLGARGAARGLRPGRAARAILRHLVVREGRNTGQALVLLVTAPGRALRRAIASSRR